MSSVQNYVIVDSSFIAHQARFSMGKLSHEEQSTGIIFGFLTRVLVLAERFETNRFLFCFDSDSSKGVRRRDWPEYKLKRQTDRTKEELADIVRMHKQLDLLRLSILPDLGFSNIYRQDGFESDDIIGHLCRIPFPGLCEHHLYIVSNDGDLAQLLVPCVSMYNPTTKVETTHITFKEENGYFVGQIPAIKAIAGCTSDNLKGIPGVGEKTALKALSMSCPPELHEKIKKEFKKNQLRLKLVTLPHEEFDGSKIKVQQPDFSKAEKGFQQVCKQYGMLSFTTEPLRGRWTRLFKGVFDPARVTPVQGHLGRVFLDEPPKKKPVRGVETCPSKGNSTPKYAMKGFFD